MRPIHRKTAPGVRGGKVQRKNRTALTPNHYNTRLDVPAVVRERPGDGYRHLLLKRDVLDFVGILPDWAELSEGLNAIVLATARPGAFGWWNPGVVHVCAWKRDLWHETDCDWVADHAGVFARLGLKSDKLDDDKVVCKFNESQARAFQLLHVLLHELGHHRDCRTTRSKRDAARGEPYAEEYALRYEQVIFDRYVDVFGLDGD